VRVLAAALQGLCAGQSADLASRKMSLPVVVALASRTPAGENLAGLYRAHGGPNQLLDENEVARAADLVEAAGGRAWACGEVSRCVGEAMNALAQACPARDGAGDLRQLADLIATRNC
jgi:geranylgeranyl diphosphate synthase, type I